MIGMAAAAHEGDEDSTVTARWSEVDQGRVLALSDGVFAIAATLLVLDIRVPDNTPITELRNQLHELQPALMGYAISFLVIGLLWLRHHSLFRMMDTVSGLVARLNLVQLALVAVLPFPTTLISRYDNRYAVPVLCYTGTVAAIFMVQLLIGVVAIRTGRLVPLPDGHRPAALLLSSAIPAGAFLVAFGAVTVFPQLAGSWWVLVAGLGAGSTLVYRIVRRFRPGRR